MERIQWGKIKLLFVEYECSVLKILVFMSYCGGMMRLEHSFMIQIVRHVTGNDQDYLRKIPRVVVQKSVLL
jgi:hypothetical protein